MKTCFSACALSWTLCVASSLPQAVVGQTTSPPQDKADTPKASEKSLTGALPKWIRINGLIRGRWEDSLAVAPKTMDSYYLDRMRLDILVKPAPWLKFFMEGQDARVIGYDSGVPPSSLKDPFDLRQAYVELGDGEKRGELVRFGRQEVVFGAGRLFSAGDWPNSSKSFDIVRGAYYTPGVRVDFVGGSIVQTDSFRIDRHRAGEHVYGLYSVFDKLIRGGSFEPYMFGKTQLNVTSESGKVGAADIIMAGARFAGKVRGRIDYSLEWLRQWGRYSSDSISAMGGTYTLGWTVNKSIWKPRISADFSHASGDDASKDGVRRTFDSMYGTFQPFSSLTGLIGWRNTRNVRLGADVSMTKNLKLLLDYRDFFLASVQDGLYNSSGTRIFLNRKATSAHAGEGGDVQMAYQWPRNITTSIGMGTLFRGQYLKESGGQATYLYPYFMWTKKF